MSLLDEHYCYEFSGIPISELLELSMYDYRLILVNAIVHEASKTEAGQNMLKTYKRISECRTDIEEDKLINR